MKAMIKVAAAAALSACAVLPSAALAQQAGGRGIVSLYHAVAGHQEALIRWLADQDRVAAAAGVPAAQLYVHTYGDAWDFMIVQPATTEAQDAALEAAAKRLGLPSGPRAGLEFRKHIQSRHLRAGADHGGRLPGGPGTLPLVRARSQRGTSQAPRP